MAHELMLIQKLSISACQKRSGVRVARELPPGANSRGTLGRLRLYIISLPLHSSSLSCSAHGMKEHNSAQRLPIAEVMAIG